MQKPQFSNLLDYFPFAFLSHKGLLSQEPFFLLLTEPKGLYLLKVVTFLLFKLAFLASYLQGPLVILLNLLSFFTTKNFINVI
jgi:hypothetical protein